MFAAATLLGFPPMKGLTALDDSLAQFLWEPPGPEADVPVTLIYFVDIDDDTILAYAKEKHEPPSHFIGKSTPRDLVANLLRRVRQEEPAVVVLDLDLRDAQPGPGDGELQKELGKTDGGPFVLIPRIVYPHEATSCSERTRALETPPPNAVQTMVEDKVDPNHVKFVHPYFELDSLGDVKGICPILVVPSPLASGTVHLKLSALSVEAVRHTRPNEDPPHRWWFLDEQVTSKMQRIQFRVGGDQKNPLYAASDGRELYHHLSASKVQDKEWPFHSMAGAIVIIGTSHKGSEENHSTPLGQMPGAVVHANIMLQLQIGPVTDMPGWIQVLIKGVLCIGLAVIHARVYVYNVVRAKVEGLRGIVLHLRYFILAAILTLVTTLIYYYFIVPHMVPDAVAVMGPIVMVCAEVLYEVVKFAEQLFDRWGSRAVDTLRGFR